MSRIYAKFNISFTVSVDEIGNRGVFYHGRHGWFDISLCGKMAWLTKSECFLLGLVRILWVLFSMNWITYISPSLTSSSFNFQWRWVQTEIVCSLERRAKQIYTYQGKDQYLIHLWSLTRKEKMQMQRLVEQGVSHTSLSCTAHYISLSEQLDPQQWNTQN